MNYLWQHPDWPNFHYDSQAIHDLLYRYAIETSKLAASLVGLPDHLEQEANIDLIVSEAIETMAIEGESLDRPSVVSSIKNQLGLNQPLEPLKNPKATQVTALLLTVREHLNKPLSKAELILIQSQRIARLQIDRVLTKAKFFDKYNQQINDRQQRAISYMFDAEPGVKERSINRNCQTISRKI